MCAHDQNRRTVGGIINYDFQERATNKPPRATTPRGKNDGLTISYV